MPTYFVGNTMHVKVDGPTNVMIEASLDAIHENNLKILDSEHFDWLYNVLRIEDDGKVVTFETCRSIEAYKRGEPNAGRYTLELERRLLQCIYINGAPVWGRPGFDF